VLPVSEAQEAALALALEEVSAQAQGPVADEADRAREKAMRYAEDCLLAPREAVERARGKWEEARRALRAEKDPTLRVRARAALERADRDFRKRMSQLRLEEDKSYGDLDRTLTMLAVKSKVNVNRTLIATAYFWLE
jgi:hypothetical protein